jgi:hypothetical protein
METSASVLLYTAEGFLPALTIILAVEVGALGLGILGGPLVSGGGASEGLRVRWLFSLVVFALAAILAAGLSLMPSLSGSGLGQGVGLGFLGGLPLFSIGSLLGAMGGSENLRPQSARRVAVPAVFGAALGFLVSGSLLLPHAATYTIYLICLVLLSGGALLQGVLLDEVAEPEEAPGPEEAPESEAGLVPEAPGNPPESTLPVSDGAQRDEG